FAVALSAGGIYLWTDRGNPVPSAEPSPALLPAMTGEVSFADSPSFLPQAPEPASVPALEAATKFVMIESYPKSADILLENGDLLGKTPARIDLSKTGNRGIVLSKEGYERKRVPASALTGRDTFRVELERLMGVVDVIQAIPWAKVYLGNRFLGDTPLNNVRLPVGEHQLRFVNEPLGVDKSERLLVRPGENPKIIVQMTPKND
ncbi:MAG: PEGA domain-containing protein, partial [Syntrophorhabdaceae bacterium]|nr:PEGA domain-containing protein [Syntrophorhabdaceae bacterium]